MWDKVIIALSITTAKALAEVLIKLDKGKQKR